MIELSPNLIFLGAGHMAKTAFVLRSQFGSGSFGLVMVEIEVAPSSGIGIALGVFNGHISAVPSSGEIASPGGLGPRTVSVLRRSQSELQLFEKDCPVRKHIRLLGGL